MRTTTRGWLVGAVACLAGLTGCGSTVQMTSGGAPLSGSDVGTATDGLDSPASTPSAASAAAAAAGTSGSAPGRSAATSPLSGPSTPTGTASTAPAGELPVSGLGYDATTLRIGVTTNKDAQATLSAVGISSGSLGDQEAITKAVMADINAAGGVLGRKLVPVFHDVKTADTSANPEGAAQQACSAFTEDAHVAAVLELVMDSRPFAACMIKHRAFVVSSGLTFTDEAYVQGLTPSFFRLASPMAEDLVPTYLGRLSALGYFSSWDTRTGRPGTSSLAPTKVGLFHVDEPAPTRAFDDIARRLTAMGIPVVRYAYGRQDASYSNAVLKFQTAGVTHILGDNASYAGLMIETAAQGYYPRYGMTSYNGGGILLQQVAPAGALAGALGVGWAPSVDVDAKRDPGSTGPAYTRCTRTMARHGVDISTRAALAAALGICDGLEVMAQSMRAGGGFDGPHITTGRATFSFEATATFSGTHNQGSIAIPTAVRDYGYLSSCSCFAYLSKANRPLR